jgi:phthalate 4,5-dioxygenase
MLSREQNESLTRVGPGTPLGRLLREYWIPATRVARVAGHEGAPVVVPLLGERFVAFRTTKGHIGFLDEACPHRGVSLALARAEGCSLRCIYHGWKIHMSGEVLETPSEPGRSESLRRRVTRRSYETMEAGGILWVLLQEPGRVRPRMPRFSFLSLPTEHVFALTAVVECNWLQAVEADLDASHVSILHQTEARGNHLRETLGDAAPRSEIESEDWGFRLGAVRQVASGERYVRIKPFVLPWYTVVPPSPEGDCLWHAFVPMDDTHTLAWYVWYNERQPVDPQRFAADFGIPLDGESFDPDNFRAGCSRANRWGQDRGQMQSGESFSGISGIALQDIAVMESMGPVVDRSREHLGVGDAAVARVRRLLLTTLQAHRTGQRVPILDVATDQSIIRPDERTLGPGQDWRRCQSAPPGFAGATAHIPPRGDERPGADDHSDHGEGL